LVKGKGKVALRTDCVGPEGE